MPCQVVHSCIKQTYSSILHLPQTDIWVHLEITINHSPLNALLNATTKYSHFNVFFEKRIRIQSHLRISIQMRRLSSPTEELTDSCFIQSGEIGDVALCYRPNVLRLSFMFKCWPVQCKSPPNDTGFFGIIQKYQACNSNLNFLIFYLLSTCEMRPKLFMSIPMCV